jgi:plasmid stabilization system protein ParE
VSLPLVLRPEAQADLLAARDWYEQQRPGLGDEFADFVEQTFDRIAAMPKLYALTIEDARRAKLRRFPDVVFYRILADRIEVIGVLHGSRDPRIWQDRA